MTTDRRPRRLTPLALAVLVASVTAASSAPRALGTSTGDATAMAWTLPVRNGQQVDLASAPDGSLLLSWVDGDDDARRLRFARSRGGRWSAPATISAGDTFGNPFDTPRLRQTPDGALWALWLRRSPAGGHARDVMLARSTDDGRTWSRAVAVNDDGTATEHGFVSTWPATRDRLGVAWLDGRAKAAHGADHGGGAQMLRTATFDGALARHGERVLDARVCDCCHTDVALTARGPLLVYRDRSDADVRDIRATRLEGGRWTTSQAVNADGWVMPGCPVNGPAVAADGERAAVAWYTGVSGAPEVRMATSVDAGGRFSRAISLDRGAGVIGRVDAAVRGDRAAVVWLREDGESQSLWLASTTMGATNARPQRVATVAGRGRGTGMPRIALSGDALHLVWTGIEAGKPVLRGERIVLR